MSHPEQRCEGRLSSRHIFTLPLAVTLMLASAPALSMTDPMRPPSFDGVEAPQARQEAKPPTSLTLSMILDTGSRRRAIINDAVVELDDVIGDARLIAIRKESVVLRQAGKTIELSLPFAEIRRDR